MHRLEQIIKQEIVARNCTTFEARKAIYEEVRVTYKKKISSTTAINAMVKSDLLAQLEDIILKVEEELSKDNIVEVTAEQRNTANPQSEAPIVARFNNADSEIIPAKAQADKDSLRINAGNCPSAIDKKITPVTSASPKVSFPKEETTSDANNPHFRFLKIKPPKRRLSMRLFFVALALLAAGSLYYNVFNDVLILSQTKDSEVPLRYNQTLGANWTKLVDFSESEDRSNGYTNVDFTPENNIKLIDLPKDWAQDFAGKKVTFNLRVQSLEAKDLRIKLYLNNSLTSKGTIFSFPVSTVRSDILFETNIVDAEAAPDQIVLQLDGETVGDIALYDLYVAADTIQHENAPDTINNEAAHDIMSH